MPPESRQDVVAEGMAGGGGASLFMVFAPKFAAFGCDVARAYIERRGGGRVHGFCTGSDRVYRQVRHELADLGGRLLRLQPDEEQWMGQPVSVAELEAMERDLGLGAFGRIVVADRRVGRGFVRGGRTRPDPVGRLALENPETAAQNYVYRLYRKLTELFDETAPELVFCYAVAGAPAACLAEICRARYIPFARLIGTRIGARHSIETSVRRGTAGLSEDDWVRARTHLADFRCTPTVPEYMARNHSLLRRQNPLKGTARAAVESARVFLKFALGRTETLVAAELEMFRTANAWRRALVRRSAFGRLPPPDVPFIYYPLHVDPEASTMVLSPWHTDQIAVIEALAKSAPAHMRIVVKEHLPMLGMRPRGFYGQIARMPRVSLVGPEHNGLELVQRAALTAVITGTAGWEAMCLRKPVLIVGDPPFRAVEEGFVHEPCLAAFPAAIARALRTPPASDEALTRYIAALLSDSFDLPSSLLWERYEEHDPEDRARVSNLIAEKLTAVNVN